MLELKVATSSEFDDALALMKKNMGPELMSRGIEWDDAWNRSNYIDNDNYSIFSRADWIGFLSLEHKQDCLFINTLQLIPEAQGKNFGYRVYEWIKAEAESSGKPRIECRALVNSSVVAAYLRLGFEVVKTENVLCELRLELLK